MAQDSLGMLVVYLSTDIELFSCGYEVLAWISFILLLIC